MIFDGFEIHAVPHITRASCKQCGNHCREVSNGFLSSTLFCSGCEIVYELKMVKVPAKKVSKEYLEQCRRQVAKK